MAWADRGDGSEASPSGDASAAHDGGDTTSGADGGEEGESHVPPVVPVLNLGGMFVKMKRKATRTRDERRKIKNLQPCAWALRREEADAPHPPCSDRAPCSGLQ